MKTATLLILGLLATSCTTTTTTHPDGTVDTTTSMDAATSQVLARGAAHAIIIHVSGK